MAIAPVVGLLGNDAPAMACAMTGGAGIALLALRCTPRPPALRNRNQEHKNTTHPRR